ncbi:MAG: glycosyltransferase family 2 protein [Patescibacteria group bacterium]|nr:glycosyltransferase family 2 protein [Patescibacteria group bacterium]MCL5224274.1 glycosyltransferase family 2 protein [Patescibacteria group bacterium]
MLSDATGRENSAEVKAEVLDRSGKLYRALEILPGVLAWGTLGLIVVLSHYLPFWMAVFIIFFDTYWLLKTVFLSLHLRSTFKVMRENVKKKWMPEVEKIPEWERLRHLVILPMYKEPYEVVQETFETLIKTSYPLDKFIVVLATEERAGIGAQEVADKIKENYGNKFTHFLVTTHPADIPGELAGKGSNQAWAAREVRRLVIDQSGIDYEDIITSVFDVDTQVGKEYFARLAYVFLTTPDRQHSSYQPVPLFINNVFDAPALARVVAFSCTFWQMMNQARPERLTTFSSHAMPFKALTEIGFWTTDHVSEDSRIFWQFFLHYDGNWKVTPLNYPVSMDANVTPRFWETMVNLYKQQRRWGWGVENVPYMLYGFITNARIAFRQKLYWTFNVVEGFHSWATNAIILFMLGWLPVALGGDRFGTTLLAHNLPNITRFVMTLAMLGVVTSATLSIMLLPHNKPKWFKGWHYLIYALQWALIPVTLIIFGAVPGLEAQSRLMFGGRFRLGFWVTPKSRFGEAGVPPTGQKT